ncbi:MAG: D-alanine--D-alanine ligase B [Verrucomicrobia bacterium ADurb.Bin345]|nr:MAG: D-alanine--D-alanine ligase B [Verrucomicrobia bacterium ADurb.Bin345]
MKRKFHKVGVLMGGPSAERPVSLRSGAAVANGLRACGYEVVEIDLETEEVNIPSGVEAVFIALHGTFGEDGKVQAVLCERGIPYTGAGAEASRVCFDKCLTKKMLDHSKVPTPEYEILRKGDRRTLSLPVVVKPPRQGSSIGVHIVFEESKWDSALADALSHDGEALVESFIAGAELTVGIVGDTVLPVIEIRAPQGFYDYDAKYTKGKTEYLVPAPISAGSEKNCRELALKTYNLLGCRDLGRVDFRMDSEGRLFVLEVNSIPGFTETSLLPKAARAAGIEFPALCDRIMNMASVH